MENTNFIQIVRLESRTQGVDINGEKDIHLESKGGDIMAQSYDNILLLGTDSIVLDSKRVDFKNLPKLQRNIDESNVKNSYQVKGKEMI